MNRRQTLLATAKAAAAERSRSPARHWPRCKLSTVLLWIPAWDGYRLKKTLEKGWVGLGTEETTRWAVPRHGEDRAPNGEKRAHKAVVTRHAGTACILFVQEHTRPTRHSILHSTAQVMTGAQTNPPQRISWQKLANSSFLLLPSQCRFTHTRQPNPSHSSLHPLPPSQ